MASNDFVGINKSSPSNRQNIRHPTEFAKIPSIVTKIARYGGEGRIRLTSFSKVHHCNLISLHVRQFIYIYIYIYIYLYISVLEFESSWLQIRAHTNERTYIYMYQRYYRRWISFCIGWSTAMAGSWSGTFLFPSVIRVSRFSIFFREMPQRSFLYKYTR